MSIYFTLMAKGYLRVIIFLTFLPINKHLPYLGSIILIMARLRDMLFTKLKQDD